MEESEIDLQLTAPSRLQFGIIDMRGEGRIHGSAGVAISYPRIRIRAKESSEVSVGGIRSSRAHDILRTLIKENNINSGVSIEFLEDIPEHSGFGSGTQLVLSLAAIVSKIFDLDFEAESVAVRFGRAQRSGIGVHAFLGGGFIVDGGHSPKKLNSVPPLIFRHPVPPDWIFVIGLPSIKINYFGEKEKHAFQKIEPPPSEVIADVARTVLLQMIPSIIEKDIEGFGDAMTSMDTKFGSYWIKIQGGIYSHPRIEEAVNFLHDNGAIGVGQSSWGPALYGLAQGETQANKLSERLDKFLKERGGGKAFITKANNTGAQLDVN